MADGLFRDEAIIWGNGQVGGEQRVARSEARDARRSSLSRFDSLLHLVHETNQLGSGRAHHFVVEVYSVGGSKARFPPQSLRELSDWDDTCEEGEGSCRRQMRSLRLAYS